MKPETAAWLARVRANAAAPDIVFVTVRGPAGSVAIFPDEIVGKSDEELLAFIVRRLKESNTARPA